MEISQELARTLSTTSLPQKEISLPWVFTEQNDPFLDLLLPTCPLSHPQNKKKED